MQVRRLVADILQPCMLKLLQYLQGLTGLKLSEFPQRFRIKIAVNHLSTARERRERLRGASDSGGSAR